MLQYATEEGVFPSVKSVCEGRGMESEGVKGDVVQGAEADASPHRGKLLLVDDDAVGLKNMSRFLRRQGHETTLASGGKEALARIRKDCFDLILTDLVMDEVDGLEVLGYAKRNSPDTEVIILTGHAAVSSAIDAMQKGAYHYLQKPLRLDELDCVVGNALEKTRLRNEIRRLASERHKPWGVEQIVGQSPAIIALKKIIPQIASTDSNILITGESGTGKELVARAIHQLSPRAEKRFLAINCGSFTEDLLANELFGHEREAYTGATSGRPGLLESADGGTIFFDEVGDMPLSMQAKLLRVIQEGELFRVGGVRPISIDVRIIGATNKDLKKAIRAGLFREDLYYRLNVVPLHLPSLAERKEDIPLLTNHFLKKVVTRSNKMLLGFTAEALELMRRYDYPGNVRELENIVERCAAFASEDRIRPEDLPPDIKEMDVFSFHKESHPFRTLEELEKEYIHWVMTKAGKNKSQAARILGIDRVSLYRKLKKYEIVEE
jgi:DNA-binding NtrC family response regulator